MSIADECTMASDSIDRRGRVVRPRSQKRGPGRPRSLEHTAVVRAALRVADTDGIAELTMARLARELGVAVMTLYHYVDNKESLLDEVVRSVIDEAPTPGCTEDAAGWQDVLMDAFLELRDRMEAHRSVVESAAASAALRTALERWLDGALVVLDAGGVDSGRAVSLLHQLLCYLLGDVLLDIRQLAGLPVGSQTNCFRRDQFASGLRRIMLRAESEMGSARRGSSPSMPARSIVNSFDRDPVRSGLERPVSSFRAQAVEMVSETRENHASEVDAVHSVATKLGLGPEVLAAWIAEPAEAGKPGYPGEELDRLRLEVRELQRANEILKAAPSSYLSESTWMDRGRARHLSVAQD